MRRSTNSKLVKKHSDPPRDAMEEMREIDATGSANSTVKYMEPNRDRTLGESDRTGRHFDEQVEESEEGESE